MHVNKIKYVALNNFQVIYFMFFFLLKKHTFQEDETV